VLLVGDFEAADFLMLMLFSLRQNFERYMQHLCAAQFASKIFLCHHIRFLGICLLFYSTV